MRANVDPHNLVEPVEFIWVVCSEVVCPTFYGHANIIAELWNIQL
jgi:hypothetical protein